MDIQRGRYRSIIIGPDSVIPIKSNPAIEAATYPLPRARYNNTPQAAHKLCHVVLFNRSKAALNARGSVAGPSSVPIDEKLLARLKHLFVKLDPTGNRETFHPPWYARTTTGRYKRLEQDYDPPFLDLSCRFPRL